MNIELIRNARLDDENGLRDLIVRSARALMRSAYSEEQIEAAIGPVFAVDLQLIRDRTFFVAERDSELVACGGWSKRSAMFGGTKDAERTSGDAGGSLDPATQAARMRAFFVHPDWRLKGIARSILERCEREARAAGFLQAELAATLIGAPFYARAGYRETRRFEIPLLDAAPLSVVAMEKSLWGAG